MSAPEMAKKKKGSSCVKRPAHELDPSCGEEQSPLDESPLLDGRPAEPIPRSHSTPQRPVTSPYTSSPVALHIGPAQKIYYVPRDLLQNPDWFTTSVTWGENIYLASIDENTGHVLVHYLHTSTYQTLYTVQASSADEMRVEFKRAILVYNAAKTHSIQGLQDLAKEKIEYFSAEMDIFDVIEAVKDDFSKLLGDTAWFHDYLNGKVKDMFEKDHVAFAKDDLFDRVDDIGLVKVLAKCVVRLFSDKVDKALSAESAPEPEISEPPKVVDQFVDEEAMEVLPIVEAIPEEDCQSPALSYPAPEMCHPEESLFEECLPRACDPEPKPEPEPEPAASACSSWTWSPRISKKQKYYQAKKAAMEKAKAEEASPSSVTDYEVPSSRDLDDNDNTSVEGGKDYPEFASCNLEAPRKLDASSTDGSTWSPTEKASGSFWTPTGKDSDICPRRARHMFSGDEWKNCRQCRAMMREIALQLARTNQDGHKTVERVLMG